MAREGGQSLQHIQRRLLLQAKAFVDVVLHVSNVLEGRPGLDDVSIGRVLLHPDLSFSSAMQTYQTANGCPHKRRPSRPFIWHGPPAEDGSAHVVGVPLALLPRQGAGEHGLHGGIAGEPKVFAQ